MHDFAQDITDEEIRRLKELSRLCRGDIIKMTTVAGSGHPGGSMSSIDIFLTVFSFAKISPQTYDDPNRDRVIVSHGHTSPGLYACLARLGYVDLEDLLISFRKIDGPYEGHVERHVPGVEWSTGNLGQGLSAGCGFALASMLMRRDFNTFVVMSDAEQAKGQVGEARRFARKYNLNNLTVLIDNNHFQISGRTEDVMPVNIKENYLADGWKVLEVSGHDFNELYHAIGKALLDKKNPCAIICNTVMAHGVSFMEHKAEFHGRAPTREECQQALAELGIEDDLDRLLQKRGRKIIRQYTRKELDLPTLDPGNPRVYQEPTHPRAVFGNILEEIAKTNPRVPLAILDCDLCESVNMVKFCNLRPENFFEAGVSEHTTATIAGALSINGVFTIWADFGVFAIDEAYNQMRLNDINSTNLKVIATHLGYNVGPDGKTHQCIDYIGLLRNLPGFKLIIPSDPNQADHVIRHVINQRGNYVIGLTRTKLPVIKDEYEKIIFDEKYHFEYGKMDLVREGGDCVVFALGPMVQQAILACKKLKEAGIRVRVYNVSSPLAIDRGIVIEAAKTGLIVSYEDHLAMSGTGSNIAQIIAEENLDTKFILIGIKQYGGSDDADVLYRKYSLDFETLVQKIRNSLKS